MNKIALSFCKQYILILAFILYTNNIKADDELPPRKFDRDYPQFEINQIKFEGNTFFTDKQLLGVVSSRATNKSFIHSLLEFQFNQWQKIDSSENLYNSVYRSTLEPFQGEYKFFKKDFLLDDSSSIWHYYNLNGFHEIQIHNKFYYDIISKKNTIKFFIKENQAYLVDTVVYLGLDSVNLEILSKIEKYKYLNRGSKYNEIVLSNQVDNTILSLKNNGYYFAKPKIKPIELDTINKTDSITIIFDLGQRVKFGAITFEDESKEQNIIADKFKYQLLEFEKGEWLSREKIKQSEYNLLSLGVFESIRFDTLRTPQDYIDSSISINIVCKYSTFNENGINALFNKTADMENNLGLEGFTSYKNLFGKAQYGKVFGEIKMKDPAVGLVNLFTPGKTPEMIYKFGFIFTQAALWTIGDAKIGLAVDPYYSRRKFEQLLDLQTLSLPIMFPIQTTRTSDISKASFKFMFEREQPVNFDLKKIAEGDNGNSESLKAVLLYNDLNDFINNKSSFFTSSVISLNVSADSRDNNFIPQQGRLFDINIDFTPGYFDDFFGLSKFSKIQGTYLEFIKFSEYNVLSMKLKGGIIYLIDPNNKYISFEKQFFTGGSNSIRGWKARTLRDTKINIDSLGGATTYNFLNAFVGNQAMIEGTIEWRLRGNPKLATNKIQEQLSNLGLNLFLDFGNSFAWLIPKSDDEIDFKFSKIAFSPGLGLIYYLEGLPPIRFDFAFPLYGPKSGSEYGFFKAKESIENFQFHFGLGFAF